MIASMAAALGLLLFVGAAAPPSGDVEARWRDEYPQAARELEGIVRAFSAEGPYSIHYGIGDVLTVGNLGLAAAGDRRVLILEHKDYLPKAKGKGRNLNDEARCVTSEYTFHIRRVSESGPYLILSYEPRYPRDDLLANLDFDFTVPLMIRFDGYTLMDRMRSPKFVLRAAERVMEGETEVVRIDFNWETEAGFESGSVYLEPARRWAIRRSDLVFKPRPKAPAPGTEAARMPPQKPLRYRTDVEYQDVPGGKPFPLKMVSISGYADSTPWEQVTRFEVKRFTLGEPPPERFRLSSFGLPDVPLKPAPATSAFSFRSPWLWGSLITALVCFTLLWTQRRKAVVCDRRAG